MPNPTKRVCANETNPFPSALRPIESPALLRRPASAGPRSTRCYAVTYPRSSFQHFVHSGGIPMSYSAETPLAQTASSQCEQRAGDLPRLLVADREQLALETTHAAVRNQPWAVSWACDAADTIAVVKKFRPHLVLWTWRYPDLTESSSFAGFTSSILKLKSSFIRRTIPRNRPSMPCAPEPSTT